jgi:DNA-binding beta-propeller fold protein YncE
MALGSDAILFFTTPKRIRSIHLNAHLVRDIQRTKQAIGVTYDGQSVYWTDITSGKESIVKLTPGKSKEVLLTAGLETPEDLAVDWLTGNIYFTDANLTRIGVCTSTGYYCTQLVATDAMDKPRAIALHPAESLLFWTDWGKNPHIGVSYMDGSDAKILVDGLK